MKIISLQPSVSVVLRELGCLDRLAACTRYCVDAVPELASLPVVHDSWSTRSEELLPVQADLVIASVPYRQESLAAILKAGRPVLALAPHSLADIYQDIRLIASVAGVAERGERLIERMRVEIDEVHRAAGRAVARPRVYAEEWGKPLIHSQEWVRELVEAAGGEFVGAPGATTDPAAVERADPDVLLFAWCGAGDRVPLDRVLQARAWQRMRAAREGRVYCIPDEWLNTPAPTLVKGLLALAQAIHPEIFGTALIGSQVKRTQSSS
jgi:iron complex transport system substrate-binding protein